MIFKVKGKVIPPNQFSNLKWEECSTAHHTKIRKGVRRLLNHLFTGAVMPHDLGLLNSETVDWKS